MSPPRNPLVRLGRALLRGYLRIGRGVGAALLFLAAIAFAAGAVVLPLWLLATRAPGVFTAATLAALGAGLLVLTVIGARRRARLVGKGWLKGFLLLPLVRVAAATALVASLYGVLLLVASGWYGMALPIALAVLILVGLWGYRRGVRPREDAGAAADDRGDGPSA